MHTSFTFDNKQKADVFKYVATDYAMTTDGGVVVGEVYLLPKTNVPENDGQCKINLDLHGREADRFRHRAFLRGAYVGINKASAEREAF